MTEKPASLSEVNELRRAGAISAEQYLSVVQDARNDAFWHRWAVRTLAALGGLHLLAGVVFFFAYNWDDLTPYAKFASLQAGILIAFAVAMIARLDKPVGQGLLIAASVFTGVLFAVIGQVYQTGADAWQLFTLWSVLILPWVLASKSSAHWVVWIVVATNAFAFYGAQVLVPMGVIDRHLLSTAIGVFVVVFLILREVAVARGATWLDDSWFQIALIVVGVGILFVPALGYVFEGDRFGWSFIVYFIVTAVLLGLFLKVRPSFPALSVIAGYLALMAMGLGGRGIHEVIGFDNNASGLILSLIVLVAWCIGVSGLLVKVLNRLNAALHSGRDA